MSHTKVGKYLDLCAAYRVTPHPALLITIRYHGHSFRPSAAAPKCVLTKSYPTPLFFHRRIFVVSSLRYRCICPRLIHFIFAQTVAQVFEFRHAASGRVAGRRRSSLSHQTRLFVCHTHLARYYACHSLCTAVLSNRRDNGTIYAQHLFTIRAPTQFPRISPLVKSITFPPIRSAATF